MDLLTLVNFTDPPTQRSAGILRNLRGGERHDGANANPVSPDSATDSRSVYPLTLHHNGRTGGPYILYAESAQIRTEWKAKLEEALGTRKIVQESNKVFEIEYLSRDTFIMPSMSLGSSTAGPTWNQDNQYTGKVTCSVPFSEFLSVSSNDVFLNPLQTHRMVVLLLLSVVLKGFGLGSVMIQSVRSRIFFISDVVDVCFSHTSCASS